MEQVKKDQISVRLERITHLQLSATFDRCNRFMMLLPSPSVHQVSEAYQRGVTLLGQASRGDMTGHTPLLAVW
jgi:hypothetical protein